ncbi:hypothetical protein GAN17_12010 [Mycobacterium kubicae]|uniref:hypothetical protein n=1 Tax=Mycobacterium kubicae TaxID=120959 RepID=UPI0016412EBD|nr:hypothetical protein [Mycobacterium kubicae]QNI06936.1 hypothetical protein GAN17_12010 [Mycobacterium kubicae]
MNVWTAIIGLAGVLGGATIGALAAIYGPQRLHKRQTDVKAAEAQTLRNEAAVQRLVALRTTGRSWLEALEQVAGDIDAGRAITLDQFDAVVGPLRSESSRTSDDLALIGRALHAFDQHDAFPCTARHAETMTGGQVVAGSNPVSPTKHHSGRRL